MSITENRRAQLLAALKKYSPTHGLVWDDQEMQSFSAHELIEAMSGQRPDMIFSQDERERYFKDPELGALQARPLEPTPRQRSAGADVLRLLRGEATLDLGDQATLEQLAEDIYTAMNKAFEFRYTTFARLELVRREV